MFGFVDLSYSFTYEITFTYKVTANGFIGFDNTQSTAEFLKSTPIRNQLALEMYNACMTQVPDSLSGRTISGISKELSDHYLGYVLLPIKSGVLYEKLKYADIGSTDVSRPNFDDNASLFESLA